MERSAKVSMSPMHLAAPDEETCIRRVGFDSLRQVGDLPVESCMGRGFPDRSDAEDHAGDEDDRHHAPISEPAKLGHA
jgi:hypothetical protein